MDKPNPALERLCPHYCKLQSSMQRLEADLVALLSKNGADLNQYEEMLRVELQAMMVQVPMVGRDVFNVVHGIKDAARSRAVNNSVNLANQMVAEIKSQSAKVKPAVKSAPKAKAKPAGKKKTKSTQKNQVAPTSMSEPKPTEKTKSTQKNQVAPTSMSEPKPTEKKDLLSEE